MKGWAVTLFAVGSLGLVLALSRGAKVAPLPSGDILLLGDSLSVGKGTLGGNLASLLESDGRTVLVNALGGRSAASFIRGSGPKEPNGKGAGQLQEAIDAGVKSAVIVLGTNDLAGLAIGNPLDQTLKPFQKIVDQLRSAGVEVYGIGAPHYQERPKFWPYENALKEGLRDIYGVDHFIDAGPLTENYKMHAGGKAAKGFAERLYAALTGKE